MSPRLCALAILLIGSSVLADQSGQRTTGGEAVVYLKNQAFYRGEVLEYEPQRHVTLRLATGEIKRFDWAAVKRVSGIGIGADPDSATIENSSSQNGRVSQTTKSTSKEPSSTMPKELESAEKVFPSRRVDGIPEDKIVWLKMSSNRSDIKLQYLHAQSEIELDSSYSYPFGAAGTVQRWRTACEYPCNDLVARTPIFRIVGEDLVTSKSFTFPKHGKRFELSVRAGEGSLRRGSWVMLTLGGIASLAGWVALVLAVDGGNFSAVSPASQAFYGLQGGGVAVMLLSIPMFLSSRTTLALDRADGESARPTSDQ